MSKRLSVLGATVAVAGLAIGTAGSAASTDHDGRTFRLVAVSTEQNFLDLGTTGTSLGDHVVFTTQLLKHDAVIGHQGGVCTITSAPRNEAECLATYSLPGGQITGQALIVLGDPAPYRVAITGGTGRYQGTEGQVRVRPATATQPKGVLTFHLQH